MQSLTHQLLNVFDETDDYHDCGPDNPGKENDFKETHEDDSGVHNRLIVILLCSVNCKTLMTQDIQAKMVDSRRW